MAGDKKLAKELSALRAEIEALKATRGTGDEGVSTGSTKTAAAGPIDLTALFGGQVPEQLQDFERAIQELAETVENDIAEHPVASVGAAFLLGVLIGRLSA